MSKIEELINSYEAPEEVFAVTLPKGEVYRFRAVVKHSELVELREQASKFAKKLTDPTKCPEPWRQFLPVTNSYTATAIFYLEKLSVEPKWTHLELLELATKAGWIFEAIYSDYNLHQTRFGVEARAGLLDELGE